MSIPAHCITLRKERTGVVRLLRKPPRLASSQARALSIPVHQCARDAPLAAPETALAVLAHTNSHPIALPCRGELPVGDTPSAPFLRVLQFINRAAPVTDTALLPLGK